MRRLVILALGFTAVLFCVTNSRSQSAVPESDTQSWNDLQVTIPLSKKAEFVIIGTLRIGDNVTFAAGVTAAARYYQGHEDQQFATIGDDAILGAHAVLVGGVHIGNGAVIGANAVVLSDVPERAVVFGSPARRVGTRDDEIAS